MKFSSTVEFFNEKTWQKILVKEAILYQSTDSDIM